MNKRVVSLGDESVTYHRPGRIKRKATKKVLTFLSKDFNHPNVFYDSPDSLFNSSFVHDVSLL